MNKKSKRIITAALATLCIMSTVSSTSVFASTRNNQSNYTAKTVDEKLGVHNISYLSSKIWKGKRYGYKVKIPVKVDVSKRNGQYYFSSTSYSDLIITPKLKNQIVTVSSSRSKKISKTKFSVEASLKNTVPGEYSGVGHVRVIFEINPNTGEITAYDK